MREAIIHIPNDQFDKLGIDELVRLYEEAGLRELSEIVCQRQGCILAIKVESRLAEDELEALEYVEWWKRVEESEKGVAYVCRLSVPAIDSRVEASGDETVPNTALESRGGGIEIALVGSQDEISDSIDQYTEAGVDVDLLKLREYRGPKTAFGALTERQREILLAAHDRGHFEVPRRASTADLAGDLDLDQSTVSEHLRRAQQNLLDSLLESG